MWKVGEMIGDREGRMDVCAAVAGIGAGVDIPAMDKRKELFQKVLSIASHVTCEVELRLIRSAYRATGDGCECLRLSVHLTGRRATDGPVRKRWKHHPHREHLWKRRIGGMLWCVHELGRCSGFSCP